MTWIAPDAERSDHYPERRNEPEQDMLRDWLDYARHNGHADLIREAIDGSAGA